MLAGLVGALVALSGAGAESPPPPEQRLTDVRTPIDVRRDVLAYHLGRGATLAQACEAVVRYFGGTCSGERAAVVVTDAGHMDATFYAVINPDESQ